MSGMSSMLRIALDRDAPPHHEPNERGTAARDATIPKGCSFHSAHCARGLRRSGWIFRISLMPLMRSTPGFWMCTPFRDDYLSAALAS